jgi:RNA polymerase sigma factor (sigma-70 family)
MVISDAEIQRGLRDGDRVACEALFDRYHGRVFRLLWTETGDVEDAADLTQETFLAVWKRPDKAARAHSLEAWLCGIALRMARSLRRRKKARHARENPTTLQPESPPSADAETIQHLDQEELLAGLQALPAEYRQPLLLFALEGLSHREVSEALRISETCARWRVSEARRRLRQWLAEQEEESDVPETAARGC